MSNIRTRSGHHFGDRLLQLAADLRQQPASEPDATLAMLCDRLSRIAPMSAAGVFQSIQPETTLKWLQLSGSSDDHMERTLFTRQRDLFPMLESSTPVQFSAALLAERQDTFFIGVPAGQFHGAPLGIGLSASRELNEDEISVLGTFGFLAGLIAENVRLSHAAGEHDGENASARLIGYVAHELRTPLTGMRGNIQLGLMASNKGQYDRISARLEAAIKSIDKMTVLVQKLLDVSRLERGVFNVTLNLADLGVTVRNAIDQVIEAADEDVSVQFADGKPHIIEHDPASLQQALAYLLSTVSSVIDPGTGIGIAIEEERASVRLVVSYTGGPLTNKDRAILSASQAGFLAADTGDDGVSLDLAFCSGIVRNHSGEILIHADSPATGQHQIEIRLRRLVN